MILFAYCLTASLIDRVTLTDKSLSSRVIVGFFFYLQQRIASSNLS